MPKQYAYADDLETAVIVALGTATTQVQEAETASQAVSSTIITATTEANQAIAAATDLTTSVSNATSAVNAIDGAIVIITNATGIDQSSTTVSDAKNTTITAQTAINAISTIIAQSELAQANTARTAVNTAIGTANTEFSQANASLSNAQDAVNALQATIATVRDVLPNTDDAGIQMILPFNMQMGGVVYNTIYVGSNATITFGTNEGWVYYTTPNAPSVSVGGMDWTTWSYGSGITYATTATTLDIAWDVRVFPTTDSSIQMTQLRFNADVNPTTGAWIANVSGIGPWVDNARWNYREVANGTVTQITDTDTTGTNEFAGSIGQGNYTVPVTTTDNSVIQAKVDAANLQIAALNQRISAVVLLNNQNQSAVNSIPSTASVQTAINNATVGKTNLQSLLTTKSSNLISAINEYIPTPPPVIDAIVFENGKATVSVSMPTGYESNTWFYRISTTDPNATNPYAGQTLNTEGSPSSFEITGLTEGATYTISVANWSGPTSNFTNYNLSIPAPQSASLTTGGNYIDVQTPPTDTTQDSTTGTDTTPTPDVPADGGSSSDGGLPDMDTPGSDGSSSSGGPGDNPDQNSDKDSQSNDTPTHEDVQNLVDTLLSDGVLTLAEKAQVAQLLIEAANGEAISAEDIKAVGLEYKDLPPATPVEVRTDANGNPVVITAEVASALLTLESPAALISGIAACINPDEAIEGLTEEQKCEVLKALANIGADMSPQERQKAKEVLVAAVLVGQVIVGSALIRKQ